MLGSSIVFIVRRVFSFMTLELKVKIACRCRILLLLFVNTVAMATRLLIDTISDCIEILKSMTIRFYWFVKLNLWFSGCEGDCCVFVSRLSSRTRVQVFLIRVLIPYRRMN